jgi:hypothetical protein
MTAGRDGSLEGEAGAAVAAAGRRNGQVAIEMLHLTFGTGGSFSFAQGLVARQLHRPHRNPIQNMAITDRTRKILWARSGNRCAFCGTRLVADATANDPESVVGEECHIYPQRTRGPRGDIPFPGDDLNDIQFGAVTWPNEQDIGPETLLAQLIFVESTDLPTQAPNTACI